MSKQYEVTVICKVKKVITCANCSAAEAGENPFDFAVDEMETDQLDWEVTDVREVP